jgi:hypothetical protein
LGTGLSGNPFDPKLVFDPLSTRWIATVAANPASSTSQMWMAVSAGSDPTGAWTFYGFPAQTTTGPRIWADYPALGMNSTWIAITVNMFRVGGGGFVGVKMWVVSKATVLAGGPLTVTLFEPGFDTAGMVDGFVIQPALTFDAAEPTLYLIDNSGWSSGGILLLRLSRITGTGASPSWAPLAGGPFPGTGLFFVDNNFSYSQIGASQLGSTSRIDTNDPRIQNAVFRNGTLWCAHSGGLPTGTADRTAAFWYQLDPTALPVSGAPIVQSASSTVAPTYIIFFPPSP